MTDEDTEGGITRRELLGGAAVAAVAATAGVGGYFVMDGNDITYPSDNGDGNGSGEDEEMEQLAKY